MLIINNKQSRDINSKAIVATNINELDSHRQKIKQRSEINNLREEVKELKEMLLKILHRDTNEST